MILVKQIYSLIFFLYFIYQENPNPLIQLKFDSSTPDSTESILTEHPLIDLVPLDGIDRSGCIKVTYVGYPKGSKRIIRRFRLPYPVDEATLHFAVKFDSAFDFVEGGKLPGLGPEKGITGGNEMRRGSWSARILFKSEGKTASYIYHQRKKHRYGGGTSNNSFQFIPSKFHFINLYIKINKPVNEPNGIYELWVDGSKVISHYNMQYRKIKGDSTLINHIHFHTFHGGNSSRYAPKDVNGDFKNVFAYFDNIELYEGKFISSTPSIK